MSVQNNLVKQGAKPKFSAVISSDGYKRMINNTLGSPAKAARFVTAITSAVSTNPALAECEASTIVSAGLLGETLNLSPSPQLGQYYLVPFKDKKNKRTVAQFQLGYKGYIQLAIRSGQYKKLNVLPIKDGELISFNPLEEEIQVQLIEDEEQRENTPTIGYYAMFEYINGFKKALYWSRAKMESHAQKYSMGYASDRKNGTAWTFWSKDFDGMACKTMLRQIISKWGIMSTEMQKALESDTAVINDNGTVDYIDTPTEEPTVQPEVVVESVPAPEPVQDQQNEPDDFAEILGG